MVTVTKEFLSGSNNGRNVVVTATTTAGTTLHTSTSTTGVKDEVWLWATNTSASPVNLTLMLGGGSTASDQVLMQIPAQDGWHLILDGQVFDGGMLVKAFAGTASAINIRGYVNRVTN